MLDNAATGTIEGIEIGMSRHLVKLVTDRDIEPFADVSTDRNPIHLDDACARDTIFAGRIAHGMLTAGLVSAVIGEQLPGDGGVHLGKTLRCMARSAPAKWCASTSPSSPSRRPLVRPRGLGHRRQASRLLPERRVRAA